MGQLTNSGNTVTFTWDIAAGLPVVIDDEDARYVYGAGLASQVTATESYYYLGDGLGSTMVTVDSAGDVVNSYTYDVFGETRSESGAQANEFQFAGQQVDGSTGLQYLRARYLDMETGRFISRDLLNATVAWEGHGYEYAGSSPTAMTDPTGLYPYSGGNKAERDWCDDSIRHAAQCLAVRAIADEATALTGEYFPGQAGADGGPANAFKHCCWIGLTALRFGYDAARGFGQRHETLTLEEFTHEFNGDIFAFTAHKYMDLANNERGISFARAAMAT